MKNFLQTGTSIILILGSDPFSKKSLLENISQNYELINLKYLPSFCQIESLNPSLIILNLYGQKKENLEHFLKLSQKIKEQYGSNLPIICLCAESLKKQINNFHFERVWHNPNNLEQVLSQINDLVEASKKNKQLWETLNQLEDFKKKVNRELEQASIFQGALFNQAIARTNLPVAYHYFFQREIGGDFFRIFDLSVSHVGILIGDVRGHGAGAAVLMGFILGELYAISSEKQRILWHPSQLLAHLSESIYSHNQMSELCSTAWYGVLDLTSGSLEYARAGHSLPLAANCEDKKVDFIEGGSGFPLGIFPGMTYRNHHLKLSPQSRLLLYTEGLLNQKDIQGNPLYANWLKDCFAEYYAQNKYCKDLPALIDSSFTDLCKGAEASDDRIILACEVPTCNQAYIKVTPSEKKHDSLLSQIEINDSELVLEQIINCLSENLDSETKIEFEIGLEELLNKSCAQVQKGRLVSVAQNQEPKAEGFLISWWIHADRLDISIRLDNGSLPWCYSKEENKIEQASLIFYFDNIQANNDGIEISMSKVLV